MSSRIHATGVWLAGAVLGAPAVAAPPPPDFGFTFVTVGDPGNTPFAGQNGVNVDRGGVGYAYRMATTEVTVGQWMEFVLAYSPFAENPASIALAGDFIFPRQPVPGGPVTYEMIPGFQNTPTNMSWRMAARYVNWLHNDKAITREAFETGVYDTATFTQNEDNTFNDQAKRSPGAKFWIPSFDEWLKAVYYDPNKGGPGEGGWWTQPAGSDTPLVPGSPLFGGQTNFSEFSLFEFAEHRNVGSYPSITTPWGLLDASGGMREWTEDWLTDEFTLFRRVRGSNMLSGGMTEFEDGILNNREAFPNSISNIGLRIASAVPAPGGVPLALLLLARAGARAR